MGNDRHGHALAPEIGHQIEHALHQFRIERARDFVKEDDFRIHGERAGDGDALLLSTGKAGRAVIPSPGKTHLRKAGLGNPPRFGFRHLLDLRQRQHDVFKRGVIRKEIEMLEHHADTATQAFRFHGQNALAIELDVATLRFDQPVEASEQCRLARAGRADDAGHGATSNIEIDAFQHLKIAIGHAEIADAEGAALEAGNNIAPRLRARRRFQLTDLDKAARRTGTATLTSKAQAGIDVVDEMRQRHGDDQIEDAGEQEGREIAGDDSLILANAKDLPLRDEQPEKIDQARILDVSDELIDERRQDPPHPLRDDDQPHPLPVAHAERAASLHLAALDTLNAGSEDLTDIGACNQAERDDPKRKG